MTRRLVSFQIRLEKKVVPRHVTNLLLFDAVGGLPHSAVVPPFAIITRSVGSSVDATTVSCERRSILLLEWQDINHGLQSYQESFIHLGFSLGFVCRRKFAEKL